MKPLTTRKLEIAGLVGFGRSNRAIAERLGITVFTVKNHIARTFKKVAVTNRTQLALWIREKEAS
jgi:DNA-binding NarL/FixJ family response regulator